MGFDLLEAEAEVETETQVAIIPVFTFAIPFQILIQIQAFQGCFNDVVFVNFITFVLEIEIYFLFLFRTPRLFKADFEAKIIAFTARVH